MSMAPTVYFLVSVIASKDPKQFSLRRKTFQNVCCQNLTQFLSFLLRDDVYSTVFISSTPTPIKPYRTPVASSIPPSFELIRPTLATDCSTGCQSAPFPPHWRRLRSVEVMYRLVHTCLTESQK